MKIKKRNKKNICQFTALIILFVFLLIYLPLSGNVLKEKSQFTVLSHDNTNFPLIGKHRTTKCSECHIKGLVQNTPTNCEVCHWERKQDDRYKLQLGYHCGECHTPFSWKKIKPNSWDHSIATGFRLEGIHKTMDCFNCHKSESLRNISGECISCHREDYNEAKSPDHKASGFPVDCTICHTGMLTWKNAKFIHGNYLLEGAHKLLICSDCHKDGNYIGLSTACFSCHSDDYNSVKEPDHKGFGFSTNCTDCHKNMSTWEGASISHSGFPLEGAHKVLDCLSCHKDGNYIGLSTACFSCHSADYNEVKDPDHKGSGFSTNCTDCHKNMSTWEGASISHSGFPLVGAHKVLDCLSCHKDGNYIKIPSNCSSCHISDYNNSENPDHGQAGFSTVCENCHFSNHSSWQQAVFNHQFIINSGDHSKFDCNDCHLTSNFNELFCTNCHIKKNTNKKHSGISGYTYNNQACYSCHPTGVND